MTEEEPTTDRLARFPRRPHRFAVLVLVLIAFGVGVLAWRSSLHRWRDGESSNHTSDMTETDAALRAHPGDKVPSTAKSGVPVAAGFRRNH
jgi:hypothetical protein